MNAEALQYAIPAGLILAGLIYYAVKHHVTISSLQADVTALKTTATTDVTKVETQAKQAASITGDHVVQIVQALTGNTSAPTPAPAAAPAPAPAPASAPAAPPPAAPAAPAPQA